MDEKPSSGGHGPSPPPTNNPVLDQDASDIETVHYSNMTAPSKPSSETEVQGVERDLEKNDLKHIKQTNPHHSHLTSPSTTQVDLSPLHGERTTNGFGVDDDVESDTTGRSIIAPYNHPAAEEATADEVEHGGQPERDPFEVGWDGGDADPMCPRSMPLWRKWLIVFITSVGSFTV